MKLCYLPLLLLIVLTGCQEQSKQTSTDISDQISSLADTYMDSRVEAYPHVGYDADLPMERHDIAPINSTKQIEAWQRLEDSLYQQLQLLDPSQLTKKADKIVYWVLKEELESSQQLRVCKRHLWNVSHMNGWQFVWLGMAEFQPVDTEQHRSDAIKRWDQFPNYVNNEIDNLKTGISQGYTMPKEIVQLVIDQMQVILDYKVEDSPFWAPAKKSEDTDFQNDWSQLITEKIIPALAEYQAFLSSEYIHQAREEVSHLNLPEGADCYQAYVRRWTTTDKSGDDIYQLGEKIVSANKNKISAIGKELYKTGDLSEILQAIKNDKSEYFNTSEEILQVNTKLLNKAATACKDWFSTLPSTAVTIKPYEAHESGNGSYEGAKGDKPAYYRSNLKNPEQQTRGKNEVLTFHEAYPGHHLQIGIQKDIDGIHPISNMIGFGSYIEGWARYTEQLAEEMNLYESQSALITRRAWPARGMVVDPGVHLKGWTKKKAIDFMMQGGLSQASAESLYHRIIVMPAQLTSYDTGGEEVKALRRMSKEQLGEKFDIKEFHEKILENGSIPLSALRSTVEEWLNTHQ